MSYCVVLVLRLVAVSEIARSIVLIVAVAMADELAIWPWTVERFSDEYVDVPGCSVDPYHQPVLVVGGEFAYPAFPAALNTVLVRKDSIDSADAP